METLNIYALLEPSSDFVYIFMFIVYHVLLLYNMHNYVIQISYMEEIKKLNWIEYLSQRPKSNPFPTILIFIFSFACYHGYTGSLVLLYNVHVYCTHGKMLRSRANRSCFRLTARLWMWPFSHLKNDHAFNWLAIAIKLSDLSLMSTASLYFTHLDRIPTVIYSDKTC